MSSGTTVDHPADVTRLHFMSSSLFLPFLLPVQGRQSGSRVREGIQFGNILGMCPKVCTSLSPGHLLETFSGREFSKKCFLCSRNEIGKYWETENRMHGQAENTCLLFFFFLPCSLNIPYGVSLYYSLPQVYVPSTFAYYFLSLGVV